ncbi:MAG: STAS/SEC14 domain-containing protein [Pseudomonadota bacterium]|nr:MAG: STAS/SEC14 domain-containing protein [Pseudomonadota bacterium]
MITIEQHADVLRVSVFSQLALADYQEFEAAVSAELQRARQIKLLLDLSNMSGFTLDVAWEDIKFTTAHAHDFQRIAVVADTQWRGWTGWLATAFTDADIEYFDDADAAMAWLES